MSEAPEYVPDPRNAPGYWTVKRLAEEERPSSRQDGSGGARRLWAVCAGCGVERVVDVAGVARAGHGDKLIGDLKLRCKCDDLGHAVLRWVNVPKVSDDSFRKPGRPRPGSFNFSTGERKGAWD